MRKFIVVLLLVLLSAGSAAAWDEFGFRGNIYGVAWLDGTKLIVALGNTSNNRINVSISTSVTDAWQWPVFPTRQISIPARTIVQEVFFPSTLGGVRNSAACASQRAIALQCTDTGTRHFQGRDLCCAGQHQSHGDGGSRSTAGCFRKDPHRG